MEIFYLSNGSFVLFVPMYSLIRIPFYKMMRYDQQITR